MAPWSLAFLPDGRALVSERRGRILLIERDGRLQPLGRLEIHEDDESGLMGLALHPSFPDPPFVYAMYTWRGDGGIENQVARFRVGNDGLGDGRGILGGIPAGDNHNGGRIAFGPDGMLYIGAGDTFRRELAQRKDSLAGKILRVTPDGQVPADNPFPGSPVWSLGPMGWQAVKIARRCRLASVEWRRHAHRFRSPVGWAQSLGSGHRRRSPGIKIGAA